MQNAKCRIIGRKREDYNAVANKKLNVMRKLTSLSQGQGARPRPVGDTGSVSWRSGQKCAK